VQILTTAHAASVGIIVKSGSSQFEQNPCQHTHTNTHLQNQQRHTLAQILTIHVQEHEYTTQFNKQKLKIELLTFQHNNDDN